MMMPVFYFLTSCESELRAVSFESLECAAFATLAKVTLDVSTLKAPTAGSGYKETKMVFLENGQYTFLLAKNLETENTEATVNSCEVTYTR